MNTTTVYVLFCLVTGIYCQQYCTKHSQCASGTYCGSCEKCVAQFKVNCGDCSQANYAGICKPLENCHRRHSDSIDGDCPVSSWSSVPGCKQHSDCGSAGYCAECGACLQATGKSCCEPAFPLYSGFCNTNNTQCYSHDDSYDGKCASNTCSKHSDCSSSEYCGSCAKCMQSFPLCAECKFLNSSANLCWPSSQCQTSRFDSVDGRCPSPSPSVKCKTHSDCGTGQYCFDCFYCKAFSFHDCCDVGAYNQCGSIKDCVAHKDSITEDCPGLPPSPSYIPSNPSGNHDDDDDNYAGSKRRNSPYLAFIAIPACMIKFACIYYCWRCCRRKQEYTSPNVVSGVPLRTLDDIPHLPTTPRRTSTEQPTLRTAEFATAQGDETGEEADKPLMPNPYSLGAPFASCRPI